MGAILRDGPCRSYNPMLDRIRWKQTAGSRIDMSKRLLPYGDVRNSDIVVKTGAHSGSGKKTRSRVVRGKAVAKVRRLSA